MSIVPDNDNRVEIDGVIYNRHNIIKVKCTNCNYTGEGLTDLFMLEHNLYICPKCDGYTIEESSA